MTNMDYEYTTDGLLAEADYWDELARNQGSGVTLPPVPSPITRPQPAINYLALAERHQDEYERTLCASTAIAEQHYKLAILNASIASAEAATRQAQVMESLLDFVTEWFSKE